MIVLDNKSLFNLIHEYVVMYMRSINSSHKKLICTCICDTKVKEAVNS